MSSMRIGGLASGIDTEQIVKDLMKVNSIPLNRMEQDKQLLEWKRDEYRDVNKLLTELDRFIFDGVGRESTFAKKTVSSSNTGAVTATNINSVNNINTTIRVDQLAEAAYMNSGESIRAGSTFDASSKLSDQRVNLKNDFTSNTFTIQSIKSDGTLGDLVSFEIDPENDSLNSVINRINKSDAGVTAFYDEFTGKLSLIANNTGKEASGAEIKVTGDFLTSSMGLATDNIAAQVAGNGHEGLNAKFNFNGLDTERSTNVFRVNGYEYTLKNITDNGNQVSDPGELVTLSSSTNTDEIFKSIVDFVNKYNEIIEKLNDKIKDERDRSFLPLTEDQKAEMTDREIDLWETKSKSGMLRNDTLLRGATSKLRLDLYSPVAGLSGSYNQLAQIGLKTSSNYSENGKLIINESELKKAINDDPTAIYQLFNQEVKNADGSINTKESGIVKKMRQTISSTINNIEARAGNSVKNNTQFSLGREINTINSKLETFQRYLDNMEDRYWKQYSYMEKALANSNSQFDMLTSFLNIGTNTK